MQNVEFKAELRDLPLARSICKAIKATWVGELQQTDTYFRIAAGRLKKRETVGEEAEFIFYDRANRTRPKISQFTIYSEQHALERFGTSPLPIWLVVKKKRELWLYRNVRIHLDQVEGLGTFLEFEALVSKDDHVPKCHEVIGELREAFMPVLGEAIDRGYSDLLAAEQQEHKATDR